MGTKSQILSSKSKSLLYPPDSIWWILWIMHEYAAAATAAAVCRDFLVTPLEAKVLLVDLSNFQVIFITYSDTKSSVFPNELEQVIDGPSDSAESKTHSSKTTETQKITKQSSASAEPDLQKQTSHVHSKSRVMTKLKVSFPNKGKNQRESLPKLQKKKKGNNK